YLPGRLIVKLKETRSDETRSAVEARLSRVLLSAGAYEAETQEAMMLDNTYIVSVTEGMEAEAAAELADEPEVDFVEPDYLAHVSPCELGFCNPTHDFYAQRKWDLHNSGRFAIPGGTFVYTGKADADVDFLEAYSELNRELNGAAVIGIIDSGIRATHTEMAGRVVAARNFAAGYPATLTDDRIGHGTHVAGIVAGHGKVAFHGIAWGQNVKLVNAKACELYRFPDGSIGSSCPSSSIANAIVWAVDNGANVLNLSISTAASVPVGPEAQRVALAYARSKNVLPFCATGNDGAGSIGWPARFEECVAVGSTDWGDVRASYSNHGVGIDLVAPGGSTTASWPYSGILSSYNTGNDSYAYMSGTSMASPAAAGLAALLWAQGIHNADEVLARMQQTVDDLGAAGYDQEYGAGRINVCRALDPKAVRTSMPLAFNRKADGTYTVVIYAELQAVEQPVHSAGTIGTQSHDGNVEPIVHFGFDPAKLETANITLGDGHGVEAHIELKHDAYRSALVDVDLDGDLDLELKFDKAALAEAVPSGTTELVITGNIGCRRVTAHEHVTVLH
ncbi:MAG TPA: S8 family serine peptidase, partial [Longimicrobium sp.]|nr:S8 family serine peptidase [Longimicrobium sp.]